MEKKFEAWALVDLFGHSRVAGRVTESAIGGQSFVQVDVPGSDGQISHTILYGAGAIYSIRIVTEDVARQCAQAWSDQAVTAWDYPPAVRRALEAVSHEEPDDDPWPNTPPEEVEDESQPRAETGGGS